MRPLMTKFFVWCIFKRINYQLITMNHNNVTTNNNPWETCTTTTMPLQHQQLNQQFYGQTTVVCYGRCDHATSQPPAFKPGFFQTTDSQQPVPLFYMPPPAFAKYPPFPKPISPNDPPRSVESDEKFRIQEMRIQQLEAELRKLEVQNTLLKFASSSAMSDCTTASGNTPSPLNLDTVAQDFDLADKIVPEAVEMHKTSAIANVNKTNPEVRQEAAQLAEKGAMPMQDTAAYKKVFTATWNPDDVIDPYKKLTKTEKTVYEKQKNIKDTTKRFLVFNHTCKFGENCKHRSTCTYAHDEQTITFEQAKEIWRNGQATQTTYMQALADNFAKTGRFTWKCNLCTNENCCKPLSMCPFFHGEDDRSTLTKNVEELRKANLITQKQYDITFEEKGLQKFVEKNGRPHEFRTKWCNNKNCKNPACHYAHDQNDASRDWKQNIQQLVCLWGYEKVLELAYDNDWIEDLHMAVPKDQFEEIEDDAADNAEMQVDLQKSFDSVALHGEGDAVKRVCSNNIYDHLAGIPEDEEDNAEN